MKKGKIKTLLLDIGGVLLTNGWDTDSRHLAYKQFNIEKEEPEARHDLVFSTYELGKLTLDDYLKHAIFYQPRNFTKEDFIAFMLEQSQPLDGAIDFFNDLKKRNGLRVIALSNEARELNEYRIKKFQLGLLFDAFVSSCYVHLRKPDFDIYRLACLVSVTEKHETLYVDDRQPYIEVARDLNIPSLHYQGLDLARDFFEKEGLNISKDGRATI